MNIRNNKFYPLYEENPDMMRKFYKRYYRKKWIRERLKDLVKE